MRDSPDIWPVGRFLLLNPCGNFTLGGVSKSGLGRGLGNLMGTDQPEQPSSGANPFTDERPAGGVQSLLRGVATDTEAPEVESDEVGVEEAPLHEQVVLEDVQAQRTLVRASLIVADVSIMTLLGFIVLGMGGGLSLAGAIGVILVGALAAWLGFLAFYFN